VAECGPSGQFVKWLGFAGQDNQSIR
jgi:hypothetical protein